MNCLSFGYYILLVILFGIIYQLTSTPRSISIVVSLCLFIWFIAGFFVKCDPPRKD